MLSLIRQLWLRLQGETFKLLLLASALLLVWGVLSPVGTLIWWLNQSKESLALQEQSSRRTLPSESSEDASEIDCYIIFLPGVGDFSANQLTPGEEFFLNQLTKQHPNCIAVSDVFPYSITYPGLGGEQLLAPLWRAAKQAKGWLSNANILIKIRNLWRFAISVDERYGPIYNQGIATTIVDRMSRAHPIPRQQPLKVILIGTSGGVQVALGASSYLDEWLDAQLIVVSIGGCFDGDTGFEAVNQMYHLQGRRDWVEDTSRLMFPSRWYWTVGSPFNQARRQGQYSVQDTGSHTHSGAEGYFGMAIAKPNTTYVELTLQAVNQLPVWSSQMEHVDELRKQDE